jgi:hypothetical protein
MPAPGQSGAVFVPAGTPGLDQASTGLIFDKNGNLYINSHVTNSVLRFDGVTGNPKPAPGRMGADFVPNRGGGLVMPSGLFFDAAGNLLVGAHSPSAGHGEIYRYDADSNPLPGPGLQGALLVRDGDTPLRNPTSIILGPDGLLYVGSRANSQVLRFHPDGSFVDVFIPQGSGGLSAPNDLLFFNVVPEPGTLALLGVGAGGLLGWTWLRRRRGGK